MKKKIPRLVNTRAKNRGSPLLSMLCLILFSQCTLAAEEDKWHYSFAPYVWLFDTEGDVTLGNTSTSVDLDFFDDVANNFDKGYEFHIEIIKGRWRFVIDPTYLRTESDEVIFGFVAQQTSESRLIELKVEYNVIEHLDLLVGGRQISKELKINIPQLSIADKKSTTWWDPVVGLRYHRTLGTRWRLASELDIGGFGVGTSSDLSWNWSTVITYGVLDWLHIAFGYRVIDIDYSQGRGVSKFQYDIRAMGPILGLNFRF